MSFRSEILSELAATLTACSSVKTVVVVNELPDMATYTKSQVPLVAVKVNTESIQYETSRYGYWRANITVVAYFLEDSEETTVRETVSKEIKNAIGGNPTLTEKCEMCQIMAVESGGVSPLYEERFTVEVMSERSIADA